MYYYYYFIHVKSELCYPAQRSKHTSNPHNSNSLTMTCIFFFPLSHISKAERHYLHFEHVQEGYCGRPLLMERNWYPPSLSIIIIALTAVKTPATAKHDWHTFDEADGQLWTGGLNRQILTHDRHLFSEGGGAGRTVKRHARAKNIRKLSSCIFILVLS